MKKVNFFIQNLKCGGCENTIRRKLSEIDGLSNIEINHESSEISFDSSSDSIMEVAKNLLSKIGYPTIDSDNSTFQKLKSYASCAIGRVTAKAEDV